ncbi:MAG: SurA N-terminal domain-containing protein, partial [Odoribacter sp.]|nr:SurA N-terminal domain-containing protein [Odoribacter sp.]
MATLQSIRNRGGILISIVIGLALFAFVVGDAFSSGPSVFSGSRTKAGEIAGENVSIMEYQREIARNEEMLKNMNGLTALNEEQQAMVRENTWQQMIMDVVMNNEYERLGIDVSGDELYDIMLGNNMSQSIREMFGNAHPDEIRDYIRSLMDLPSTNPQKAYWLVVEQQIAESQKQAKFNNLLLKGLYTTDAEVQQYIDNTTTKADISYILKSYSSIS